jgi:Domain of unknown function (DUF4126)
LSNHSATCSSIASHEPGRAQSCSTREQQFDECIVAPLDSDGGRFYRSRVIPVPHEAGFDLAVAIAMGVGLAAAVGFRVFLPMLVLSIAAYSGHLTLSSGLAWLGTPAALVMLGVAAVLEILAYYIPGVDNVLDVIAAPAALIAGTVVSAAVMTDVPPMIKWTTAVIAGGGAAGLTQGLTSLLRAKSTVMTAGLGNHVVATGELGGALIVSLLALAAPLAAVGLLALFCWLAVRLLRRLFRRDRPAAPSSTAPS